MSVQRLRPPEPAKKPTPPKKPRRRYDDDDDGEGASRRKWLAGLAALLLLGVVGYGMSGGEDREGEQPVFPAQGKVLVQGQPIANASIAFHSKDGLEERPLATTASDGTFKLTTYRKEDGAPAGKYVVTVIYSPPIVTASGDTIQGPNLLPKQYASPKTSDLTFEIVKGDNELAPIDLAP